MVLRVLAKPSWPGKQVVWMTFIDRVSLSVLILFLRDKLSQAGAPSVLSFSLLSSCDFLSLV